ncbi:carbohydrate kinase [Lysinibacillus sp. 2017]|uniref:carbohydrate kinase n=1 Tax=unclassified Lysinibacillus TaxID=2636778 RepID=UPI000D528DA0|nr:MULTISPECIES: carbohydrate kinase [unclassified Lysinibacillus]AWE08754.1 carbohydrate kinase [Lysinibacillus sp. 2017]TGN36076.1 winged helix-turn-helix transcriptional regulator [Lysinibacillus sp. S2017]
MNEKEKLVFKLIKENPFLSQQEMAEQLGMSRPALANIISALIKRGEILGRAYVLPEKNQIITIGGANVDRKFSIEGNVQLGTSNPAKVSESVGGVARNIAENLGRLGNRISLITTLGDDHDGRLIEQSSKAYMNFDLVEKLKGNTTGSYTAVLDDHGELVVAMANMSIYSKLSPMILKKHEVILQNASCLIIDLNCSAETVQYVKDFAYQREVPLVIVPVSSPKMMNMPSDLHGVDYLICNRDEAETYLNVKLETYGHYEKAVKALLEKGAKYALLTLGEHGVMVGHAGKVTHFKAVLTNNIVDVTGAGDAFVSAFLHGVLNNEELEEAVQLALVSATKTLQSDKTVREDLTKENLANWRNLQ